MKIVKLTSALLLGGLVLGPGLASGDSKTNRYPYDPACPWGRVADGRGMLERCLSEAESKAILAGALKQKAAPAKQPSEAEAAAEEKPDKPVPLTVELGPLKADEGTLKEATAVKSLSKANTRYVKCVNDHGGLAKKATSAEVKMRFLVRGRGRAEGTEVSTFKGMTEKAAKCIADVVDRRFVGHPSAPVTGATFVITVKKK